MTLTQERLRELLHYDPDTGVFTWKISPNNRVHIGDVAGTIKKGHVAIRFDGGQYYAHRLAWLYVHGEWPLGQIDHENEIKTDNRIVNLRQATDAQNKQNVSKPRADSKTGYRGVHYVRKENKYTARIKVAGVLHLLGHFITPEEANEAYLNAKAVLHPFWEAK